jgi:putative transposase
MHEEIQMKMTRYSEPQILAILRQAEGGVPVAELCREHGMSNASFYKWRPKYGGIPLCQGSCPLLYFSLFFRWAG